MLLSDPDDIARLRIRVAEQARELAALREAAGDAAAASAERLRAARQDAAALRRALDEAQALEARSAAAPEPLPATPVNPSEVAFVPLPPVAPPAASPRRTLRHAAALPIWRLIRPVARPVLWRVRTFFTADAVRELAELRASQREMQQAMRDAALEAAPDTRPAAALPAAHTATRREYNGAPGQGLGLGDTAAERWLLTVALESAQTKESLEGAQA